MNTTFRCRIENDAQWNATHMHVLSNQIPNTNSEANQQNQMSLISNYDGHGKRFFRYFFRRFGKFCKAV